jgi:hypothetical protein
MDLLYKIQIDTYLHSVVRICSPGHILNIDGSISLSPAQQGFLNSCLSLDKYCLYPDEHLHLFMGPTNNMSYCPIRVHIFLSTTPVAYNTYLQ